MKNNYFTKSDIAYATYSYKKFTITGNEPGTTILWIKTYNNIKKQIKITVRKPSTPKLKTTSLSLLIGEKYVNQLLYSSSSIKWKSSNKRIATVDKKGKITAKKSGSCTITAISGGKKFSCKVKVVRLDPNFGAVLYDYNSRGKTYTVKFKNNGKKSITILSSNAKALHDDYKSLDRSLKVKKTVIKPGKTAYIKFRASKQPYYDSDEYTIQYKFTYDGATYTGQTWCEESIYKKGKSWYGTYWTSYEDWYQSWIWD